MTSRTASLAALALALSVSLAACSDDGGDGGGDTASDPDASSSTPSPTDETPSPEPSGTPPADVGTAETVQVVGSAGVTQATMVHQTEVGGYASTLAFALDTDQAVVDFVNQFDASFAEPLGAAIGAEVGLAPQATPYAATVAVGCDAPRSVAVDAGEAGFEVVPKLPKSSVQCLAPMPYVVVFTVPDS
ncbi:MAG TPA: hypothetical protein VGV65_05120 [Nocardioides sp.]|nr:hypothetical protein [Nocardioides sp.]